MDLSTTPKISVILSTHNNALNVKNSIYSVLNQSYKNFELLVLDDGSSDDTWKVLNSIYDSRLKLFRNNINIGLTKSLNKLISYSNGIYIARQDDDDISLPHRFEKQLNILSNTQYSVCTSRAIVKNTKKTIPGNSFYLPTKIIYKFKNPFIHGTMMIDKSCINILGGYDENFYYAQDYKLFSDLINNKFQIYQIKEPLYILNMEGNISSEKSIEQNYYAKCVKKNIIPNL
jgi:glycosyltransferase involved in cell wall biosynthesis